MYILAIEDNPDLVENLYDFFEVRKHIIDAAYTGKSGLQLVQKNSYDVIVLDLMLPDMDGLKVCQNLRAEGSTIPILMLTARDTLDDKILGFNHGADDYLVKPFSLRELEARLQALVRRIHGEISQACLTIADLSFNPATVQVTRNGQPIELPPIQLKILEHLMRQAPKIVLRQDLERYIWGEDLPETDSLRTHLHTLRTLIDKPFSSPLIHTVRGIGYRIAELNDF